MELADIAIVKNSRILLFQSLSGNLVLLILFPGFLLSSFRVLNLIIITVFLFV